MSEEVKPFGTPLVFEHSANAYCKFCYTWGNTEDLHQNPCGNCGNTGYMIPNPFPGNMIPYIRFEADSEATRLSGEH